MYRRRRGFNPTSLLLLGVFAGIVFFIYDNILTPDDYSPIIITGLLPTETDSPTVQPTAQTTQQAPAARGIVSNASIFIPSAGVISPIVEVFLDGVSWDVSKLGKNVGHLQGTAWLDKSGNVVLSGHVENADGSRGVFASLLKLEIGEPIIVTYQGVERRYAVIERHYVEPDDLTPVFPTADNRLTLITCDSYDFFQDAYLQRVVVVAERID